MSAAAPIRPTFHHFNLKTTRLQELINWYAAVVGTEVIYQDAIGAWLTNDAANHMPRRPGSASQRCARPTRGRELIGADDLEVLVDEDVVRPVDADVVDLVLAVAQLHNTVDDAPG